jgi:hypothetical protein
MLAYWQQRRVSDGSLVTTKEGGCDGSLAKEGGYVGSLATTREGE